MRAVRFVSFGKNPLRELAREIVQSSEDGFDFSETWVLLPSKRAATFLKAYMFSILGRPFFSPRTVTPDELPFEILGPGCKKATGFDELSVVYEVFSPLIKEEDDFFKFKWCLKINSAVKEVLSHFPDGNIPACPLEGAPGKFWDYLRNGGLELYVSKIKQLGLLPEPLACVEASDFLKNKTGFFKKFYLSGLYVFTPVERMLLRAILQASDGFLFLVPVDTRLSQELKNFREGKPVEDELIKFLMQLPLSFEFPSEEKPEFQIQIKETDSTHLEVEDAIREVVRCVTDEKTPQREIAVVLNSDSTLIPLVNSIKSLDRQLPSDLEFNITMGYPLSLTPTLSFIRSIVELFSSMILPHLVVSKKNLLKFLSHPYIQSFLPAELLEIFGEVEKEQVAKALSEVVAEINSNCPEAFSIKDIPSPSSEFALRWFEVVIGKFLAPFTELFENYSRVELKDVLLLLKHVLEEVRRSVFFPAEEEASLSHFSRVLKYVKEIIYSRIASIFVTPPAALRIVLYLLERQRIPFVGEPLRGVQIMGPLELRLLGFKKIFLLDANETTFLSSSRFDPLLPTFLRKETGMFDFKVQERIYEYNLMVPLERANLVVAYYKGQVSPSRFLEKLSWRYMKRELTPPPTVKVCYSVELSRKPKNAWVKKVDILQSEVFYPTYVDYYIKCPLNYYFRKVLGLQSIEPAVEREISPLDTGKFVHKFLQLVFQKVAEEGMDVLEKILSATDAAMRQNSSQVLKSPMKSLQGYLKKALGSDSGMLAELEFLKRIHPSKIALFYFFFLLKIRRFLWTELNRYRKEKFQLLSVEQEFPPLEIGQVKLSGKPDRVESFLFDSGRVFRVIDYKTGFYEMPNKGPVKTGKPGGEDIRRFMKKEYKSIQIPVYMLLVWNHLSKGEVVWGGFYNLRKIQLEEFSFKERDFPLVKEWLAERFPEELKELFTRIFSGVFEPDFEDKSFCFNCPYHGLCLSVDKNRV